MWEAVAGTLCKTSVVKGTKWVEEEKISFVAWHSHACHLENLMRGNCSIFVYNNIINIHCTVSYNVNHL